MLRLALDPSERERERHEGRVLSPSGSSKSRPVPRGSSAGAYDAVELESEEWREHLASEPLLAGFTDDDDDDDEDTEALSISELRL